MVQGFQGPGTPFAAEAFAGQAPALASCLTYPSFGEAPCGPRGERGATDDAATWQGDESSENMPLPFSETALCCVCTLGWLSFALWLVLDEYVAHDCFSWLAVKGTCCLMIFPWLVLKGTQHFRKCIIFLYHGLTQMEEPLHCCWMFFWVSCCGSLLFLACNKQLFVTIPRVGKKPIQPGSG